MKPLIRILNTNPIIFFINKGNGNYDDAWIPTANVSNFSDMPAAVQAEATSMGESSGESCGD